MKDKTDPRLAVLDGLFSDVVWDELGTREGVSLAPALAALDAADLPDALRSSRDRMLRERTSAP